jgi:hypothetical protein
MGRCIRMVCWWILCPLLISVELQRHCARVSPVAGRRRAHRDRGRGTVRFRVRVRTCAGSGGGGSGWTGTGTGIRDTDTGSGTVGFARARGVTVAPRALYGESDAIVLVLCDMDHHTLCLIRVPY